MYNNTLIQNTLKVISRVIPFSFLRTGTPIMPFYHLVSDEKPLHIKHLYKFKNVKEFISDLDFFLKNFQPLSLHDILDYIKREKPLPGKSFFLSFDDGLREVYTVIAPILKGKGIPATFFLNSAFIDNKGLFYRYKESILIEEISLLKNKNNLTHLRKILQENNIIAKNITRGILNIGYKNKEMLDKLAKALGLDFNEYLKNKKPYLDSDQINDLIRQGFTIGAHSVDHPLYSKLNLAEQLWQTEESLNFITNKFNLGYSAFAFPFLDKDVNKDFFRQKKFQLDASFGSSGMKREKYANHFQRLDMEVPFFTAAHKIRTAYLKKRIQKLIGKDTIIRNDF